MLVLVTTGRRSGRRRETPLAYAPIDGAYLVVGGAGGESRTPDWVLNLRAEPKVAVIVDRLTIDVIATELAGAERAAMWERLLEPFPQIEGYERTAGRVIPVVRLDPR